jgi:predicted XRE-type DNA-binding protein
MRTLQEIKGRCRINDDGCWIWTGAMSVDDYPRIYAPDFTAGGKMRAQTGRRAVWHIKTGKPIASGWRVFGTCDDQLCLNPAHSVCQPVAERGAVVAASGKWRGSVTRLIANRRTGRRRSVLTPEMVAHIRSSTKKGIEVARELGVPRSQVSRVRSGKMPAFEPVGGLFSGLLAANDSTRKAA